MCPLASAVFELETILAQMDSKESCIELLASICIGNTIGIIGYMNLKEWCIVVFTGQCLHWKHYWHNWIYEFEGVLYCCIYWPVFVLETLLAQLDI